MGGGGSGGVGEGAGGVAGGFAEPDVVGIGAVAGIGCAALFSVQASRAKSTLVAPPSTTTASNPRATDRLFVAPDVDVGLASAMSFMRFMSAQPIKEQSPLLRIATRAR